MRSSIGPTVPVVLAGPEQIFGVEPVHFGADGVVSGTMPVGPWLSSADAGPDRAILLGSLGVLVDDVMGYAINAASGSWSVSTEISLEVAADVPPSTGSVRAEAKVVHVDSEGALAHGRVMTEDGEVIAFCQERGRWITNEPPAEALRLGRTELEDEGARSDLVDLLGAAVTYEPPGLSATVEPRLANPLGILHGGVSICLADVLASEVVRQPGRTASIRAQYVRGVPLGESVTFSADVEHRGRSLAVVRIVGRNRSGKACVMATVVRQG